MADHLCIVGLFRQDVSPDMFGEESDVWTVNDWYRCYPWMLPERVFNLHSMEFQKEFLASPAGDHRYPGDWFERYTVAAKNGTQFVLLENWGLPNELVYPADEVMDAFPKKIQFCGITAMILLAVLDGYKKISLVGVKLRDDEYKYQISGIMDSISIARTRGIEVINPYETEWAVRAMGLAPDVAKHYDNAIAALAEKLRVDKRRSDARD